MNQEFPFHEYLVIPGWWQTAYRESSKLSELKDISLIANASKLLPALKVDELEGVSFALGQIQRKLLSSENGQTVYFDFHQHLRDCSHKQKKSCYQRAQQILPFLSVANESYDYKRLFGFEGWKNSENSQQAVLDLNNDQTSMTFGIQSATTLLNRSIKQKKYHNHLESSSSLTMVSIPIWLELKAVEKQLFLWMLQEAKNFENWAGLDGEVAISLNDLHAEVSFPKPRGTNASNSFENMMRSLERFLPKLHAHGWLSSLGDDNKYFNMPSASEALSFVWQMSADAQQTMFDAPKKVAEQLLYSRLYHQSLQNELQLFGLEGDKRLLDFPKTIQEILKNKNSDSSWIMQCDDLPNVYFDVPTVFLEIIARSDPNHPIKLPDWVSYHNSVREITSGFDGATHGFKSFEASVTVEKEFLKRFVEEESLAAIAKNRPEDFLAFCDLRKRSNRKVQLGIRPTAIKVKADQNKGAMSTKLATATINEMIKTNKKSFQSLKMKYYDSLSEVDRGLILEIQSRMQPHLFQDQIKQRLVKFLMQHSPDEILHNPSEGPLTEEQRT